MIRYTKAYIEELIDKYMNGISTLDEEDVLTQYFAHEQVPAEWEQYRLLFSEIEAMSPDTKHKHRWLRWGSAAAIAVIGMLTLWTSIYQPSGQILVAKRQISQQDSVIQNMPKKEILSDTSSVKTHHGATMPKIHRSLRKPQPTITDYDKASILMAQAEKEQEQVIQEMEQTQQEVLHVQLITAGYIAIRQDDGTIIYTNKPKEYFAYEE